VMAVRCAAHFDCASYSALVGEVVRFPSLYLVPPASLPSGENMRKEIRSWAGRTALGDNHWMGSAGAKAKMYVVRSLLSCREALDNGYPAAWDFLGRTGSFLGTKLQGPPKLNATER
jgi:hypothetical protein